MGIVATVSVIDSPLLAQIDYRNLDEGRPVTTEDAYPVERYAFELVLPYLYANEPGPRRSHLVVPELAFGIAPNMHVGAKLPLAALAREGPGGGTDWGFGGPRLFALYNFNTEAPTLPAFALRTDLALPLGDLAGDDVRVALTGIATRSWGRTRAHFNAAAGFGGRSGTAPIHGVPEWAASVAVDRTLLRRSLLVIGALGAREHTDDATEVTVGFGARMQLTPTIVVDAGVERRLGERGPDLGLTVGLSHAFAFAGLMPSGVR
jgi:hypothetical protein